MKRYYYSNTISSFLKDSNKEIIGILTQNNELI